jgi:cytochrome c oxidase assembly protein subunit 15
VSKSIGSIAEQASVRASPSVSQAAKKAWPESDPRGVGLWLIGSAVSVFGIVVFGGLTRLTESGYVIYAFIQQLRKSANIMIA